LETTEGLSSRCDGGEEVRRFFERGSAVHVRRNTGQECPMAVSRPGNGRRRGGNRGRWRGESGQGHGVHFLTSRTPPLYSLPSPTPPAKKNSSVRLRS
jgi:hypothetical protein